MRTTLNRIGAAALAVTAAAGCGKSGAGGPPGGGAPPGMPVTAAAAVTMDEPVYIDEIGHTTPVETVTIVPQVSGKILARHFTDGDPVKKGQLLFEIDPAPFQAVLDQAKGQLAKDQATLASAKWNVDHDQLAMVNHSISEQQLHSDTATRDQSTASIDADNAQVAQAQLNLDYCRITSPIDGLAGERLVDVGNVINGGGQTAGTNLLVINKIDPIYADFTVTEAELARVQAYMGRGTLSVRVETPADAQMASMAEAPPATQPTSVAPGTDAPADKSVAMENRPPKGGMPATSPATSPGMSPGMSPATAGTLSRPRTGRLVFLDNAVQDASGTVRLRAEVPNADHHFWPGQYVNVRLVLTTKRSVMVPVIAEQVSQQGLFVYKVTPSAASPTKVIAAQQSVTIGQRHGDLVVIDDGLAAGDQVVTTGQMLLQPGAPIMVIPSGPPPTGGPPPAAPKVGPADMKSPGNQGQPKSGPQASAAGRARPKTEGGSL